MTIDIPIIDSDRETPQVPRESFLDSTRREALSYPATFGDIAELWLEAKVDVKESTRACYQSLLRGSAREFWLVPVEKITHLDIMAWVARLVNERGFGPVQVHSVVGLMRATLDLARRLGVVDSEVNPAQGVPLPRLRAAGGRLDQRLTLLELELLACEVGWWTLTSTPVAGEGTCARSKGRSGWLRRRRHRCGEVFFQQERARSGGSSKLSKNSSERKNGRLAPENSQSRKFWEPRRSEAANRLEVLTRVLGYCGLRVGEALALTWKNIDWEAGILHVNRAVTEVSGRQVFDTPKSGRSRTVPIPKFLLNGDLARLHASFGSRAHANAFLFPTNDGVNPLRASNLRYHFDLAAAAIGHPGLHIHDLRHTAASLAVSAGANVKAVAQMLGHSSAALTLDVYADLFAEDLSAVGTALDALRRREIKRTGG